MKRSSWSGIAVWGVCLYLAGTAQADDGAVSGVGGTVHKLKGPPTIRMVWETVSIKVPDGRVRAVFAFQNDGPATYVTMGFPESGGGGGSEHFHGKTAFGYFHSWVDGKRVMCRLMSADNDPEDDQNYSNWWVKKVHFGAGQRRTVVDEYSDSGGGATDGSQWIPYILSSGATWKGNIGYARITADVGALGNVTQTATPSYFRRVGRTLVWEFRNFKPSEKAGTDEVNIVWYPGFKSVWFNGKDLSESIQPNTMPEYSGIWPSLDGSELTATVQAIANWIGAEVTAKGDAVTLSWKSPSGRVRTATVKKGSKVIQSSIHDRVMVKPAVMRANEDQHVKKLVVRVGPVIRALGGTASYNPKTRRYRISM